MEKVAELSQQTTFCDEVEDGYDPSKELVLFAFGWRVK
jgi:hypothetical protein